MPPPATSAFVRPIECRLQQYLAAAERQTLLRFITCGNVDDGKSTLIGRLLYDSKLICASELAAVKAASRRQNVNGARIDFALLVDGLAAEREQGITIDVAHRYFATSRRKFIVADTPGHTQYTRNMITGASTADVAVILIDARNGVQTQTRRHSYLAALIGIHHVMVAVNKMDLVSFSTEAFDGIVADYRAFADKIGIASFVAIPISARYGDNIATASARMPWYRGPTLIEHLEEVAIEDDRQALPFRLCVQWVNRAEADFRGFAGTVASGTVHPGDPIRVLPRRAESRVARIVTRDGDLHEAVAGQSVTLTLADEIDVSRGDILCGDGALPEVTDEVEATVIWMAEDALAAGRPYWLKIGSKQVTASVAKLVHAVNIDTLDRPPAATLALNEIGLCQVKFDRSLPVEAYAQNRETGAFILIDRMTNATVGAGLIQRALRPARNIHWQALDIGKQARASLKGQKPSVLWFTGLSGAGKSTIANLVEKRLHAAGRHTYLLDGDNVRHGLNGDLGFSDADRMENLRRAAEVAKLMVDAGLIVIVSFISPFARERRMARELFEPGEFIEVFVDTPLAVAETRDPKGLYRKARRGELKNFTGIDSAYERPLDPEITIETRTSSAEAAAEMIVARLGSLGIADGLRLVSGEG
jgi:bifunctional enzyme CysN/CysC